MPRQSFNYPGLDNDDSFDDPHLNVLPETALSGASTPASETTRTSVPELQKIIKKYQLENGKLKLEVSELKKELTTLIAAQPKKGRRGRKTNEEALAPEAQIAKYGAYFQVANEPWVELDVLMRPRAEIDGQNSVGFGTTDAENADRITHELFSLLPHILHPAVQTNPSSGKAFVVALNQQRVNSIRRMRDCADIVFREYNLPAGWFLGNFDRNIDPLKAFLKFNIADKTYPNLPPICYSGLKKDQANVFRVRIAAELIRAVLFGKDSISAGTSHAKVNMGGTVGWSWKITKSTPGVIAFGMIAVQFLVSPDPVFSKVGAVTGINYQTRFWSYKKLLTTMANNTNIQSLYKFWDAIVFSHLVGACDDGEAFDEVGEDGDAEVDEMEELMNKLQLEHEHTPNKILEDVPNAFDMNRGENAEAAAGVASGAEDLVGAEVVDVDTTEQPDKVSRQPLALERGNRTRRAAASTSGVGINARKGRAPKTGKGKGKGKGKAGATELDDTIEE